MVWKEVCRSWEIPSSRIENWSTRRLTNWRSWEDFWRKPLVVSVFRDTLIICDQNCLKTPPTRCFWAWRESTILGPSQGHNSAAQRGIDWLYARSFSYFIIALWFFWDVKAQRVNDLLRDKLHNTSAQLADVNGRLRELEDEKREVWTDTLLRVARHAELQESAIASGEIGFCFLPFYAYIVTRSLQTRERDGRKTLRPWGQAFEDERTFGWAGSEVECSSIATILAQLSAK